MNERETTNKYIFNKSFTKYTFLNEFTYLLLKYYNSLLKNKTKKFEFLLPFVTILFYFFFNENVSSFIK